VRTLLHDAFARFFDAPPDNLWEATSLPHVRPFDAETEFIRQTETLVGSECGCYGHNEPQLSSGCPTAVGHKAGARFHSDGP
jgi:hypothetical protein